MEALLVVILIIGGLAWFVSHTQGDGRRQGWLGHGLGIILKPLAKGGWAASKYGISQMMNTRQRVRDPESVELLPRERTIPNRTPGLQELRHGVHWTPAGLIKAVHMGSVAVAGGAKGQTVANNQIQFQLQYSNENLLILEVKPNQELSRVVAAHARPGDRIFIYTAQPQNKTSSGLYIPPGELENLAHAVTHDPGSKDPHWNRKSGQLIPATAEALRADGHAATLGEVAAAVMDRRTLGDLVSRHSVVDNIADTENDWGNIRSTVSEHLSPLKDERLGRVFAGSPNTPQPFDNRGEGRDIVIIRPHEPAAAREARFVVGLMDILFNRAVQQGYAGGPGTYAVLDEFASFLDLSKMRRYLDLGRGGKLQLSYFLQGRSQLAAQVGQTEADSILDNTEIKAIGPTQDQGLAEMVAELSGNSRVEYQSARQRGELLRDWREESVPIVKPNEITSQQEANWTTVHKGHIYKNYIAPEDYHHVQAAAPQKIKIAGIPKQSQRSQ